MFTPDAPLVAGEEILTEVSAKFRRDGIAAELATAGFEVVEWWTDPAGEDPDAGTFDAAGAGEAYVPATIICVDCGSTCHLITPPYEDPDGGPPGFQPGDVVAYRCEDCLDRWDIVVE